MPVNLPYQYDLSIPSVLQVGVRSTKKTL
ncbi:Protein of unknown function [Gryllus bimaculatus]|nr:Protein of unknown function [Gryllus bimaculatus]